VLLSIVLVGLPEMRDRLSLHKNRSLWSRIHTRVDLGDAAAAATAEYSASRLKRASVDREVFSSEALSLIHEDLRHGHRPARRIVRVDDAHRAARALPHQLTRSETPREAQAQGPRSPAIL
jgi:type II secretory pathway predicted ATPase ExeA